jgi:hypothetical protein
MRTWLLLSLIFGIIVFLGYRLLRRNDPDVVAEADRVAHREWRALQQRGFWRHVLTRHAQFFFVLFAACVVFKTWRVTGSFVPDLTLVAAYGAMALGLTLFAGWLDWRAVAERAAKAQQRNPAGNERGTPKP